MTLHALYTAVLAQRASVARTGIHPHSAAHKRAQQRLTRALHAFMAEAQRREDA